MVIRYFTGQQLKELFVLDNPKVSETQKQLEAMHSSHRKTDTELDSHIAFLFSTDIFGISDHDLMFSQEAHVEPNQEFEEEGNQYVQQRVQRAQELVAQESDLTRKLNDHIRRGTEGPGGAKKRYSMNVNRERLQSEWAEKSGEGVINPPLQNVPKYYKPEDRQPSRGVDTAVEDLDRTMEELSINDSRSSYDEEVEDLAQRSPSYQSNASQDMGGMEEVLIIDDSPLGSGDEGGIESRPGSVFVVDDDSRPGSRSEDSCRPGSTVEDKAFIGESYLPEDSSRGPSRNDDDNIIYDQDEEMEDYIDDHSSGGESRSNAEAPSTKQELLSSANESLDLVVGMTPPRGQNGDFQVGSRESSRGTTSFYTGEPHGGMVDDSGSLRSRNEESKQLMPSDTDSYGMMEVSSGQPSDLPHFNATRKLSLEESRSLTCSQMTRDEEADFKANTIDWENGRCSSQDMRCREGMTDQDMSASGVDDVGLDSEDDEEDGSYGEVVEVSVASFCCQADGDVRQDMDVSNTVEPREQMHMIEDQRDDEVSESSVRRSPHPDLQSDEVEDENSYEDVSMASFSVQTDDVDNLKEVQSTNLDDKSSSHYSHSSVLKDQQSLQKELFTKDLSSINVSSAREGPPEGIDLDATSRFLGLTSEESPFLKTSSPVSKARHVRRIVSDEEEDDGSVFERDTSNGGRVGLLDDEGVYGGVNKDNEQRDIQLSTKRKKPSSVLVDDSDDEEMIGRSNRSTKSSLDTEQSAVMQESMSEFIVGDSDEEQQFEEPLDKGDVVDESLLDESEESSASEVEEEIAGRKRRKKHVIISDDEEEEEKEEDGENDPCISKTDGQYNKAMKKIDFIAMEAEEGRSTHDTGRISDEEIDGEDKELDDEDDDEEENEVLKEDEMVDEEEQEDSYEHSVEDEEEEDEAEENTDEEEEEEESDGSRSEDESDMEMRAKYKALVKKGMSKVSEGDNKGALRAFLQALYIDGSSEKLQLIALKLKKKLENQ
nr:DNA excision repair protein ERCC-6-like [Lytechinus pictus]